MDWSVAVYPKRPQSWRSFALLERRLCFREDRGRSPQYKRLNEDGQEVSSIERNDTFSEQSKLVIQRRLCPGLLQTGISHFPTLASAFELFLVLEHCWRLGTGVSKLHRATNPVGATLAVGKSGVVRKVGISFVKVSNILLEINKLNSYG